MTRFVLPLFLALAQGLLGLHPAAAEPSRNEGIPLAEPFEYTRLYADSTGASHFADETVEFALVEFAPPAPAISLSQVFPAQGVAVMSSPPGWHGDWHPAPQRQFVFVLAGELEVEVSDGEVRRLGPGAVALVEDTHGVGHISRVVSKERTYCVVIPLTEGE